MAKTRAKAKKLMKLPPGTYTGAKIKSVTILPNGLCDITWDLSDVKPKTNNSSASNQSEPTEGLKKFFIVCNKLTIYTSIGADNKWHASNKATKLFGPHWSFLTEEWDMVKGNQHCTVANFNALIKTLEI